MMDLKMTLLHWIGHLMVNGFVVSQLTATLYANEIIYDAPPPSKQGELKPTFDRKGRIHPSSSKTENEKLVVAP